MSQNQYPLFLQDLPEVDQSQMANDELNMDPRDRTVFSRYNMRYFEKKERQATGSIGAFDPVASWIPFILFGAFAILVCLIWLMRALGTSTTIMNNSGLFTAGIAIFVITVIVGIILVALTAHITARNLKTMSPSDAIFTALGKTTIMLIIFVVVWIFCMFVAS